MTNQSREITGFLFGQYFSDGIRITVGVLLPSLVLAYFDQLALGLILSLGALCASIADTPGPVIHKRNGMLYCNLFCFLTALLTGWASSSPVFLSLIIFGLAFFYSMFLVYGNRASAAGISALLVMVLSLDQDWSKINLWYYAFFILGGGLWYMALSLSISQIRPYRLAQQALGESIREVAVFLRNKAEFYQDDLDYEKAFRKLIDQQVIVHNQQDIVRELLFKNRVVMKESTRIGRLMILVFVDVVDLFEQTMATYYDYQAIRKNFRDTGVLSAFQRLITKMAGELDNISHYIIINKVPEKLHNLHHELEAVKAAIDQIEKQGLNVFVLKKILINARNITNRLDKIYSYFEAKLSEKELKPNTSNLTKFVSHQSFDPKLFLDNLNFKSSIFRYALRFAIVCLAGYTISKLFLFGTHSYWILLTILVILKPGFTVTKQRNYQRLIGTFAGAVIGAAIVYFIKDETFLFVLLLFFMIASYSFQRLNYTVSVLFMTPYVLILFALLGLGGLNVAEERIIDTLVGCLISFIASYTLLPSWEYYQLRTYAREVLVANYNYLCIAANGFTGNSPDSHRHKLARKAVYVASANLSSSFQRMLSEPRNKQRNSKDLHKFLVLNHSLSSYIATLISPRQSPETRTGTIDQIKLLRRSLYLLSEAVKTIDANNPIKEQELPLPEYVSQEPVTEENRLISEQLEFVEKITRDIQKLSEKLV
ncbi:MAG TPA: FUSC family membrane protein [Sphingobacteriaceae bacterium]